MEVVRYRAVVDEVVNADVEIQLDDARELDPEAELGLDLGVAIDEVLITDAQPPPRKAVLLLSVVTVVVALSLSGLSGQGWLAVAPGPDVRRIELAPDEGIRAVTALLIDEGWSTTVPRPTVFYVDAGGTDDQIDRWKQTAQVLGLQQEIRQEGAPLELHGEHTIVQLEALDTKLQAAADAFGGRYLGVEIELDGRHSLLFQR